MTNKSRSTITSAIWPMHGFLHLIGYDHETRRRSRRPWKRWRTEILAQLGIPDPYADQERMA